MGIMIFDDFSMPFSTPFTTMKCVASRKTIIQSIGRQGLATKLSKAAMNWSADLPAKLLVAASRMYSSVQPDTTE